ncbi:MAG: AAA family ATPase [bacterium]
MDLRDYYEIILKRRWIILFVSICVVAGYSLFFFTQTPTYTARGRLLLRLPPEWQDMPVISMPSWQTRVSLVRSKPVLEKASRRLKKKGLSIAPGSIQGGLRISPEENTDFIDIYYTGKDPEKAKHIVKAVMKSFLKYDRKSNSTSLANAEEALNGAIVEARRKLQQRETQVAKLRKLRRVSRQVDRLENEFEKVENRFGTKHPRWIEKKRELDEKNSQLHRQYRKYFPEKYSTDASIEELKVDESELNQAERNLQLASNRLSELQNSLDQVTFNKSLIGQSANSISTPDSTSISYPTNYKTYGFVIMAGVILGISTGAFLEYFDDRLVTKFDIHRYLGIKVLGEIPDVQDDEINLLKSPQKTPLSERYHSISILIEHSLLRRQTRNSLLITSSIEGEGKTTTCVNLAVSLAREGERVLLIDMDLRDPQIHKTFGLMNSEGSSSILTGSLELEHAMFESDDNSPEDGNLSWDYVEPLIEGTPQSGLDVLPSGPLPSNPIQAIKSDYTENLIQLAKDNYSLILIDSPPLNSVVDPVILSTLVDGVLMVLESGRSRTGDSQHAMHLLEDVDANILGIILNKMKRQIPAYYSYYSDIK